MIQDVIRWYHIILGHGGVTIVYKLDSTPREYQFIAKIIFAWRTITCTNNKEEDMESAEIYRS